MNHKDHPPVICGRLTEKNKFVVVVLSDLIIGVSVSQFNTFPSLKLINDLVRTDVWINANRNKPETVSIIYPSEDMCEETNTEDSTQIALETALWLWSDWSPNVRSMLRPQPPIFSTGGHLI